ncbi:MAG: PD-(D/E)XK nuclease family protein [Thermoplasmata archaeon]|nr:PD-(D/E)XK nuclease family protein [Thermoplasmata archaeon]
MTISELSLVLLLGGVLLAVLSGWALVEFASSRRYGRVQSVDRSLRPGRSFRSERFALVGRPDEVRVLRDGRLVPVELKSRGSPPRGPPPSHRAQLMAYAFLIEEETRRTPPYGVLKYGDGGEFVIDYGPAARSEVVRLLREVEQPYDGRATPSPGKCRACPWVSACDASAA